MSRARRLSSLLLLAGLPLAASCNRPTNDRFAEVTRGMSPEEVTSLLGEPSSRHRVPPDEVANFGYVERWHYGDTLSSLATHAMFPDAADDRVFVVFFGPQGDVVATRAPVPGAGAPMRSDPGRW